MFTVKFVQRAYVYIATRPLVYQQYNAVLYR